MSIKIGLVGLPNVGKSSLFHFLTKKNIKDIANYPFATIEPNFGIMKLVDPRLEKLSQYWKTQKTTPSVIEIIDIAGLVKGASQGLGLGNEFLSHIREVDLICHVLRCFPKKEIVHVEKSVDPLRDFEIIQLELILADLQQIKKRLGKIKLKDEKTKKEQEILQLIQKELENGKAINQLSLTEEEKEIIKPHNFLTKKPFFLLANYSGEESEIQKLETYAHQKELDLFPLAIKLEGEVEELTTAEKEEIGWKDIDLSLLTEKIKKVLNLKTFFTVGKDEVKSWLAEQKMEARACAGLIHSDIQKNFISVEVYNYTDWEKFPSQEGAKYSKKRGAEYLTQEGDICYFFFGR